MSSGGSGSQMPDEDPKKLVDASQGRGQIFGPNALQFNLFLDGSPTASGPADSKRPRARRGHLLRVYISGAPGELDPYRQAAVEVCDRLRLAPVFLDPADLNVPQPAQLCQDTVESCDVLVLLAGRQYGQPVPGTAVSQAELEFQYAAQVLPVLPFITDPSSPTRSGDVVGFVNRIQAHGTPQRLADIAAFREDLIVSLSRVEATLTPAGGDVAEDEEILAPVTAPAFHALPPYVGGAQFTGRAHQFATLDDWARSADPVMVVEAIGGTGKSALTWQWAEERAETAISGLAGRLWWSFYDGSASMTRFMRELLSYMTGQPERAKRLARLQLLRAVIDELKSRPYLVILDGFERLLAAYHQFDPSKIHDEGVQEGPSQRSMIEPFAEDIIRELTTVVRSKILISTRLMPISLQSPYGNRRPGVRHLRLQGLTDPDTHMLLERLGVRGGGPEVSRFFGELDNHPLLIGVVAGLVRDYRPEPGNFGRWVADPAGGAQLTVPDLDLTGRRRHILQAALAGLAPGSLTLLGYVCVLPGSVRWDALEGINPFRPDPSQPDELARAQLIAALKELEDRGLLWWERSSNTYDLHPIIRAYAYEKLEDSERLRANGRVRDYFQALPPDDPSQAASVEDLTQTIIILRALIETDNSGEASQLWSRFNRTFMHSLSAYATVAELLGPLAAGGSMPVRASLAVAYHFLGRYEDAASLNADRLVDYLRDRRVLDAQRCLSTMSASLQLAGALRAAQRCIALQAEVSRLPGGRSDVGTQVSQARLAAALGKAGRARRLLRMAQNCSVPDNYRWLRDDLEYLQLYLDLETRRWRLTGERLIRASKGRTSLQFRRDFAGLRAELWLRRGDLGRALAAAQEHDQLSRNAGLEVAPARIALILARLGQTGEATAAAEDAVSRLSRLHAAQRPHYHLAEAFWKLDERAQAASHARDAWQQAWADGPPYSFRWNQKRARRLLKIMGESPSPVSADQVSAGIPREDEIRTLITTFLLD
jgi:uncharacterized protein DUF4062